MVHDVTSFWTDIKKYEEVLTKDPASYNFVPLAELYRKVGLPDEAIQVAKKGCEIHPDYVGGFMALGRAYFEKGMKDESRAALEKVISFTPDNFLARRLLSQIYVEKGETAAAEETLRFILSHNPADHESRVLLDSLNVPLGPKAHIPSDVPGGLAEGESRTFAAKTYELLPDDEEIIEDAELVEELEEFVDEEAGEADFIFTSPGDALSEPEESAPVEEGDPLVTVTLAELYASQGFLKRALTIYRELLESDPDNEEWKSRLYELKMAIDEDTAIARNIALGDTAEETETTQAPGLPELPGSDETKTLPPASGDAVLATLEKWLDTIRRRR